MSIQRTLGRFPSPTPCWFLVRMYLCGYVACSARALAHQCWMCCANEPYIVGPRFDDRETIEMLALVRSEVWPVSNFIQQLPTSLNNTQDGVQTLATSWAQQCCERWHGPLYVSPGRNLSCNCNNTLHLAKVCSAVTPKFSRSYPCSHIFKFQFVVNLVFFTIKGCSKQ